MLSSLGVGVNAQMAEAVATTAVRIPMIPSLFSLKYVKISLMVLRVIKC